MMNRTPFPRRWPFLLLMLSACLVIVGDLATSPAWAQPPADSPVRADVLRLADGSSHLGTLKSFDGAFFEFQTVNKLHRFPRAEVVAIVLAGANAAPPADATTVKDIDGNVYKTVRIGHQVWFAENLRTTRYHDGAAILQVTDFQAWGKTTGGAYTWYMNNADYKTTYGGLYNFATVETKKICPKGWHVPVAEEWANMINSLGANPGARLKEPGTKNWRKTGPNVTNDTGFTALPTGYRNAANGQFAGVGNNVYWWTATPNGAKEAFYRGISDYSSLVWNYAFPRGNGLSIRCVRD